MPIAVRETEPWAKAVGVLFEHGVSRVRDDLTALGRRWSY